MFSQIDKARPTRPTTVGCIVCTLLLALCPPSKALDISFDGTGYSADGTVGTVLGVDGKGISGQGSPTKWADYGTDFAVVSNAGNGGDNNGLVSATNQIASKSCVYTPSYAELGVEAFTERSIQHFSLDVRLIDDGDLGTAELYRLGIGLVASPTFPVELGIRANSDVYINMGAGSSSRQLTLSGALTEGGDYRTFSGTIDYARRRVNIFLDGQPQGSYAFSGDYSSYGQFKFNVRQTSTTIGIAIDNLSAFVTKIPDGTVIFVK
ncbi:MAG: hypothetical protein ACOX9C_03905 [Kiritimatiellia bacterium]